jgi:hypothetical protein
MENYLRFTCFGKIIKCISFKTSCGEIFFKFIFVLLIDLNDSVITYILKILTSKHNLLYTIVLFYLKSATSRYRTLFSTIQSIPQHHLLFSKTLPSVLKSHLLPGQIVNTFLVSALSISLIPIWLLFYKEGYAVAHLVEVLRYKPEDSIPDCVIGILLWHNPPSRTTALRLA